MELTKLEKQQLKSLKELCVEDDLLDLDAYNSIERADKIDDAWKALKVLEKIYQVTDDKLTHCLRCSSPLASYEKEHCSQCQWHIKEYGE